MLPTLESATPTDISTYIDNSISGLAVLALFLFLMFTLMIVVAIVTRPRDTDDHDG